MYSPMGNCRRNLAPPRERSRRRRHKTFSASVAFRRKWRGSPTCMALIYFCFPLTPTLSRKGRGGSGYAFVGQGRGRRGHRALFSLSPSRERVPSASEAGEGAWNSKPKKKPGPPSFTTGAPAFRLQDSRFGRTAQSLETLPQKATRIPAMTRLTSSGSTPALVGAEKLKLR